MYIEFNPLLQHHHIPLISLKSLPLSAFVSLHWYTGLGNMVLRMATPWKHPDTGTYYINQRVPSDIVAKAKGRTVIIPLAGGEHPVKLGANAKLSLRTKEPKIAKQRFAEASAALQDVWQRLRQEGADGPLRLTTKQVEALAGEYYRDVCARFEQEPGNADEWQLAIDLAGDQRNDTAALEKSHGALLDWILAQRGLVVDRDTRNALLRAFNRAFSLAAQFQIRRAEGDYSSDENADRFPRFEPTVQPSSAAVEESAVVEDTAGSVTLAVLFELWRVEHSRQSTAESTVRDFGQKLDSLKAFLGHEDVRRITARSILEWTEHLMDAQGLAPKTVRDKYLAAVKAVFKVGVRKFRIDTDPSAGVVGGELNFWTGLGTIRTQEAARSRGQVWRGMKTPTAPSSEPLPVQS